MEARGGAELCADARERPSAHYLPSGVIHPHRQGWQMRKNDQFWVGDKRADLFVYNCNDWGTQ